MASFFSHGNQVFFFILKDMKTKMLLKDSTHQNKGEGVGILLTKKILGSSLHHKNVWRASQRENWWGGEERTVKSGATCVR